MPAITIKLIFIFIKGRVGTFGRFWNEETFFRKANQQSGVRLLRSVNAQYVQSKSQIKVNLYLIILEVGKVQRSRDSGSGWITISPCVSLGSRYGPVTDI